MGFSSRSLVLPALLLLALAPVVLTPTNASAQGATAGQAPPTGTPPPAGGPPPGALGGQGGGAAPGGGAPSAPAVDDKRPASTGNVGGVSFNDKPVVRRAPVGRAVVHRGGPLATFPGFEQMPDGGSRLFVQLSQSVPVEERRAQGSITYVLKGAHLRVHNDANALVTVHFNTPVFRARLTPQGNDLLFVLELRSAASPTFKVADNQDKTSTLQIDFPKGDFIPGDGSETLPSEVRATRAGTKGGKGAQPSPNTPPANNGDNGPNP